MQKAKKIKSSKEQSFYKVKTEVILRIKYKFNDRPIRRRVRKVTFIDGTVKHYMSLIKGVYDGEIKLPPFDTKEPSEHSPKIKKHRFDPFSLSLKNRAIWHKERKAKKIKYRQESEGRLNTRNYITEKKGRTSPPKGTVFPPS